MKKYYKIGSLSLSVNAIVILVLGITMLGLGLAFTKGMFGKLAGKLEIPPPNIPATASEPIVLPADEININGGKGKETIFTVNVFHDGTCPAGDAIDIKTDASYSNTGGCFLTNSGSFTLSASSQKIPEDQFRGYKIIAKADGTNGFTGSCVVSLQSVCSDGTTILASKQITISSE